MPHSASAIEFVASAHKVCRLRNGRWTYAERRPDGTVAHLPIGCKPLADIYRQPCEAQVPSGAQWDSATPAWAHGRRAEILRNIGKDMGIDAGRKICFVDAPGDHPESSCGGRNESAVE